MADLYKIGRVQVDINSDGHLDLVDVMAGHYDNYKYTKARPDLQIPEEPSRGVNRFTFANAQINDGNDSYTALTELKRVSSGGTSVTIGDPKKEASAFSGSIIAFKLATRLREFPEKLVSSGEQVCQNVGIGIETMGAGSSSVPISTRFSLCMSYSNQKFEFKVVPEKS